MIGFAAKRFLELLCLVALRFALRDPEDPGRGLMALAILVVVRVLVGLQGKDRLAFGGAVVVALGLGEGLLRIVDHPWARVTLQSTIKVTDRELGWVLRPGAGGFDPIGYRVAINGLGIRGPATTLEKPAGTRRVLTIGDSYTYGIGVEEEETFSRRLEAMLRARVGKVEVVNGGTPSFNAYQIATWLETRGMGFAPEVVVYAAYFNDPSPPHGAAGVAALLESTEEGVGYDRFCERSYLLSFVRCAYRMLWYYPKKTLRPENRSKQARREWIATHGQIMLLGEVDLTGYFAQIERMRRRAEAGGARFLMALIPDLAQLSEPGLQAFNRKVAAWCETAGIPFLDATPLYEAAGDPEALYLLPRDFHTSAKAHAILASALVPMVEPALRR